MREKTSGDRRQQRESVIKIMQSVSIIFSLIGTFVTGHKSGAPEYPNVCQGMNPG